MSIASKEYGWDLQMERIAKIWRAGCIIRATLLDDIMAAYRRNPRLENLLGRDSLVAGRLTESWRVRVRLRKKPDARSTHGLRR